jgi:peptide/nickel transport system substrate-binding protein
MLRARRRGSASRARAAGACGAAAAVAVALAACSAATAGSSVVGTTPADGGTATFAMEPSFNANYIFPFDNSNEFTVPNTDDFQYLLYRPLYWFGTGNEPYLNTALSLAYPPVYSGQTVTIRLKDYRWSNGEQVSAQDVIFWMNMMRAEAVPFKQNGTMVSNWGGYVPGYFPTNVSTVKAVSPTEVTMTIKGPYSKAWFTDNELSQITPMPLAWDVTATGPSDCVTAWLSCRLVYNYLNAQAQDTTDYGASKIWSVVDGPWRVKSLNSLGYLDLVLNPDYSGPLPEHHISQFIEMPFTSEQSEYNVLLDPQGTQKIDVGYLPTVDAPMPAPDAAVGANPDSLGGYKLSTLYPWSLNYFPYNFQNTQGAGAIFDQLYFRQTFQSMVDQEGVIEGPLHGYGKVTYGPVGDYPVTKYLSPLLQARGDQWALNPGRAARLLKAHGWSYHPGGTDTCVRPGTGATQCGAGIHAGAPMKFSLIYASGTDWMESAIKELVSNASLVGITINAAAEPIGTVISAVFGCAPSCGTAWQLAFWGSWTYSPDYLPTGEELFLGNAASNGGNYNNPEDNLLITKTLDARNPGQLDTAMWNWENWLAPQLPVVYMPDAPTLMETVSSLHTGIYDPVLTITPEDWYYLK